MTMQLFHKSTGKPVAVGDVVTDFRDEVTIVTGWAAPRHEGSTGRVYVSEDGEQAHAQGFYPSVFELEWRA